MRNLVVCCDGTWQAARNRTNVWRLFELLDLPDEQKVYVEGVGTGGLLNRLEGALTAAGLERTLLQGYRFLVDRYQAGDRISLFGFSRGAYTARSLAGMIGRVGIVDRTGLDDGQRDAAVRRAYERYRALRAELRDQRSDGRRTGPEMVVAPGSDELPLVYHPDSPDIPVAFIGVWDTVGALGIPSYIGVPDLFGTRKRYEFLNVVLDPRIPHARHAVALDEMRGPFRPTLWKHEPGAAPTQDIEQVWFPGDHQDVGGGRTDTRLSDGTLQWMVVEASAAVGLPFRPEGVAALDPDPAPGAVHGMPQGGPVGAAFEVAFQPRPRAVPLVDPDRPLPEVAPPAHELQKRTQHLPPAQQYRPSRTLQPGEHGQTTVEASRGWNATDLWLEADVRYAFAAEGEWSTPFGHSGPAGIAR